MSGYLSALFGLADKVDALAMDQQMKFSDILDDIGVILARRAMPHCSIHKTLEPCESCMNG